MSGWAWALAILGAIGAASILWMIDAWILPKPVIRPFMLRLFKKREPVPDWAEELDKDVKRAVAPLEARQLPKANIVFGQPSTVRQPTLVANNPEPFFCYIPIWNDPSIRTNEATAETVFATVSFYNGEQFVWANDKNCWSSVRREDVHFMSMATLPANGQKFLLYIAVKYEEDSHCYFPTYDSMHKGGREDKLKLDYPELNVNVRLQGLNMEDMSCKYVLRNFGKGKSIELISQ